MSEKLLHISYVGTAHIFDWKDPEDSLMYCVWSEDGRFNTTHGTAYKITISALTIKDLLRKLQHENKLSGLSYDDLREPTLENMWFGFNHPMVKYSNIWLIIDEIQMAMIILDGGVWRRVKENGN